MSAKHVILGAGAVGRSILDELVRRGESVRVVNRSGNLKDVPVGVEVKAADLYDPAQVREVTRGAQVVYQAAVPPYHEVATKFPSFQRSILEGLTGSDAKLVIVENLYMYGSTNGAPMTEETPHNAHTRKGRARKEASQAAFEAHRTRKVRVTSARGSDYFGPWGTDSSTTFGSRQLYPLLQGKTIQMIGKTDIPHTHTYLKDFGRALVVLGERDEADGRAWHVPNDQPRITQGEMLKMFAEEAGLKFKMTSVGAGMLRFAGFFSPPAKELVEMMYEFDQPFIVDSSKFEKTFGMKATPMQEAIRETVAWFKSHP